MTIQNKIESVLFSVGGKIEIEEIARLCRAYVDEVKQTLQELKKQYDEKQGALMIIEEGTAWKITVREKYLPLVQKIVPHTELTRTITETLATIAWKAPILQSKIVEIRSNKAYDHIKELVEMGFISKERKGRSYMLKTTQKFNEYFDTNKEKLKDVFKETGEKDKEEMKKIGEMKVYEAEKEKDKLDDLEIVDATPENKDVEAPEISKEEEKPKEETEQEEQPEEEPETEQEPEKPFLLEKEKPSGKRKLQLSEEETEEETEEPEKKEEEEEKEEPKADEPEKEKEEVKEEETERKLPEELEEFLEEKK